MTSVTTTSRQAEGQRPPLDLRRRSRPGERVIEATLMLCGLVSVLTTVAIVYTLVSNGLDFFRDFSAKDFFTGTTWQPKGAPQLFGVLPLLGGTLLVSAVALVVALPLGLGAATYLSEYARPRARRFLKPLLELLAGIPTVVYGYFALRTVTPVLKGIFGEDQVSIFNALSAGLVMGIMIIPTIASLSEDAMRAVPQALREGAFGLGSGRRRVATRVVIPAALSGIAASVILGISRAVGETMIVAVAAGSTPNLTVDVRESIQTMTGYIAQVALGDSQQGTVDYQSIFAVGFTLFVMTLALNLLSQRFVRRFRQVYQ
ncbi:MAG TPA: phosphate ABC transporter permease subunit PstC [Mycobacteriales bacterium]|nr:phosphate ABC transporter permease subunit PstC [Mycobacteriales bacterium]